MPYEQFEKIFMNSYETETEEKTIKELQEELAWIKRQFKASKKKCTVLESELKETC